MTRKEWTDAVYEAICKKLRAQPDDEPHFRGLAESIAEQYSDEEIKDETPDGAVDTELSYWND